MFKSISFGNCILTPKCAQKIALGIFEYEHFLKISIFDQGKIDDKCKFILLKPLLTKNYRKNKNYNLQRRMTLRPLAQRRWTVHNPRASAAQAIPEAEEISSASYDSANEDNQFQY